MSVCLQFLTFKDVRKFIQVNTKCYETVKMLKVNPFFINSPSVEQFCQYFKTTTLNLLNFGIFDSKLFSFVECIKNPYFDEFFEENKEEIKALIPKIKSFDLNFGSVQTEFFIENATLFNNIQRIEGDIDEVVSFLKNYSNNGTIKNVSFPRVIQIDFQNNEHLEFSKDVVRRIKQLKSYIPDLSETKVYLGFGSHAKTEQKHMLSELQGINYSYYHISNSQCILLGDNFALAEGSICMDYVNHPTQHNHLFEMSYCDSCITYGAEEFCKDGVVWNIPSCTKTLEINSSASGYNIDMSRNIIFLFDMNNIINLSIVECENILFCHEFKSLKHLSIKECENICFNSQQMCRFNYCLDQLEQLHILNSEAIEVYLTSNSLQTLMIGDTDDYKIHGNIDNIKKLMILFSMNGILPNVSFENKEVLIEESNASFDNISPMEYMNISLNQFQKLMNSYINLPYDADVNKDMFIIRKFTTFSTNLSVVDNTFQNKDRIPFSDMIHLISYSFYHESNPKHQLVWSNGKQIQLPATIHYFEINIIGHAVIEIGLFNKSTYDLSIYEDSAIGWEKGTIGYHSDDGCLYFEDITGSPYGPKYGEEDENHVVGCGFNTSTNEAFFVCDGVKLKSKKITWKNIASEITIEDFEEFSINYGETPFVFDLAKAISGFNSN
ncbi:B30.2/SPRY domain-containing protein [Entamoeba marina]